MSVLIVGAVGTTIALAIILSGLASSRSGFAFMQSAQANALAYACAEEALQQIRDSTPFTGSGNLSLGQGACTYTVLSQGGQNRTVDAVGTVGTVVRKMRVTITTINPQIVVSSWQEVAN